MTDMTAEIEIHDKVVILKDGGEVLLRPMTPDDCQTLIGLFATAPDEDVLYLRDDVRDPAVAKGWCENLNYGRVFPLMALADERAVGQATLHFGCGPERHCGRVRIFVAKDFRRRGLGKQMINVLIDLARRRGLHMLIAEIVLDQARLIKACIAVGFELCHTLKDSFMLPDGNTRSVATLRKCLQPPCDEFGPLAEE